MRRTIAPFLLALGLVLLIAAPAAAGGERTTRFSFGDDYTVQHACGIVEHTTMTARGTASFDANGDWVRDHIVFTFTGTYVGPAGATLTNTTRQVVEVTPGTVTLRAQGIFIHAPRIGTLVMDVGRLVVDEATGSTLFASARVIPLDDLVAKQAIDEALCEVLG